MRSLLPKVTCAFDPEIEAEFPTNMSGKLTIEARGQTFEQKVVVPKGEPSNFLSEPNCGQVRRPDRRGAGRRAGRGAGERGAGDRPVRPTSPV